MTFDLRYVRTGELESYIHSDEYSSHGFVAISHSRAVSHARNPRADKDDIALILAYDAEKFIGYLGMIPELVFTENKKIKVCWLSCMWVLPEYRRSGIATHLLSDAHRIYKGLVFITNYIPRSKAAFFKSGHYIEIVKLYGVRAYLRFDLATILPRRNQYLKWIKPLLTMIDIFLNTLISINDRKKLNRIELYNSYELMDKIDGETGKFIDRAIQTNPFRRSRKEFEWMKKHPWVTPVKDNTIDYRRYYFSQHSPDFKQWFIRIRNDDNQMVGFMILTRHKHELKTPYIIAPKEIYGDIFLFIRQLMINENIPTLVTYQEYLSEHIKHNGKYFITIRHAEYGFIATKEIEKLLNGKYGKLYDGDGDGAFT